MDTRLKERLVGAVALVLIVVLVVPELLTGPRKAPAPVAPDGPRQVRQVDIQLDRAPPGAAPIRNVDPAIGLAPAPATTATPPPADASAAAPAPPALAAAPPVHGAPAPAATVAEVPASTPPAKADSPKPDAPKGEAPKADAVKPSAAKAAPDATRAAPVEPPRAAPVATPKPAPAESPKPAAHPPKAPVAAGEGWVVQLGSFASRDNGEKLAKTLRGKGYRAFVSEFRGSGRILYRVRVGPEQDRSRADAIAARLSRDGYKGSVAPH